MDKNLVFPCGEKIEINVTTLLSGNSAKIRHNFSSVYLYSIPVVIIQHPIELLSLFDEPPVIRKILKHLKLWDFKIHDSPVSQPVNPGEQTYDNSFSQILPENSGIFSLLTYKNFML